MSFFNKIYIVYINIYRHIPIFKYVEKKQCSWKKKKQNIKIIMHETYLEFVLFSILKSWWSQWHNSLEMFFLLNNFLLLLISIWPSTPRVFSPYVQHEHGGDEYQAHNKNWNWASEKENNTNYFQNHIFLYNITAYVPNFFGYMHW